MVKLSDTEQAERLTRKRARLFPILAVLLISQQGTFFVGATSAGRTVDQVRIGAWIVLTLVILLGLWTGGSWLQPRAVRDLINDEGTRANRAESFRVAFLASMLGCIFLYLLSMVTRVEARDAIHIVVTIGLSAALLSFGLLERRALADE